MHSTINQSGLTYCLDRVDLPLVIKVYDHSVQRLWRRPDAIVCDSPAMP